MGVKIGLPDYVKTNGRGSAETRNGILPLPCFGSFVCQKQRNWNTHCWADSTDTIPVPGWRRKFQFLKHRVFELKQEWKCPAHAHTACPLSTIHRYIQHARSVPYTATHCGHVPFIKGAQNKVGKTFKTKRQEVIFELKSTSRVSLFLLFIKRMITVIKSMKMMQGRDM